MKDIKNIVIAGLVVLSFVVWVLGREGRQFGAPGVEEVFTGNATASSVTVSWSTSTQVIARNLQRNYFGMCDIDANDTYCTVGSGQAATGSGILLKASSGLCYESRDIRSAVSCRADSASASSTVIFIEY